MTEIFAWTNERASELKWINEGVKRMNENMHEWLNN